MVEQDARAAEHAIGIAVFLHYPVAIQLGHSIGAIGVERCILVLWHLLHLAVQLAGGCLIDATSVLQMIGAHCLQDAQYSYSIHIGCKLGSIEAHLHMALCCQVVDFGWHHLAHQLHQRHRVAHVGIVKVKVGFSFQVRDALTEVNRRAADDSVHLITLLQKQFAQVRTVLPSHSCDEGNVFLFHVV